MNDKNSDRTKNSYEVTVVKDQIMDDRHPHCPCGNGDGWRLAPFARPW
jgi:hypothetical protein